MATQPIERDPRLGVGGNKPPLAETVVMEFDQNLREYDFDLLARIKEIEVKSEAAGPCMDADTAGRYGETVKSAVAAIRVIDEERETLNRPILTAQRALIGAANVYKERLTTAELRLRRHLDDYTAREKKRRDDAERERLRLIAEAEAEARQIAETERQRLQAIADADAARERARLQAIENERAAAEAREVKAVEVFAEVVEVEVAPIAEVSSAPVYAPVRSDRGVLVSSTETWHVEIENVRQVPDLYLKSPAVIEALQKVIAPSVRGKNGLRQIKGCRIYATTKASVR